VTKKEVSNLPFMLHCVIIFIPANIVKGTILFSYFFSPFYKIIHFKFINEIKKTDIAKT